jgi:hypothetical protein
VRRSLPRLFAQLWVLPLVLLSVSNSYSQVPPNQKNNRLPVTVITQDGRGRDWIPVINRLEEDPRQRVQAQLALRQDFRKLQVINLDLLKLIARTKQPLDNDSQKKARSILGEINKLAERLRTGFGLPEVERIDEKGTSMYTLVPTIVLLDKAITNFVENPLFQQPKVFDSELAVKAANDANEISRLTGVLRNLL